MAAPPVLLLPVRLETMVLPQGAGFDLLVRVFPDDVHADAHEVELTPEERDMGRAFWSPPAGGPAARSQEAWNALAGRFGDRRAAYIAHTLDPGAGVADPGTRLASWSRAARTDVLPTNWVAYLYDARGGLLMPGQVGGPVRDPLQLSHDPAATASGVPPVDPGIAWLVSWSAALEAGMALRVPLTAAQRSALDAVLVVGWNQKVPPEEGARRVASLLTAHRYTGGLALVPQGTPTSNTSEADAAHAPRDRDHTASYTLELGPVQAPAAWDADVSLLAAALGVDPSVLARAGHAGGLEQRDAAAMNATLWAATWGYFLDRMMAGGPAISDATMAAARRHFIDHVRAAGPLPAIRAGAQPYGVLPAISLDRWAPLEGDAAEQRLVALLRLVRPAWAAAAAGVPAVSGVSQNADADLAAILAQDGIATSLAARPALGPGYFDYLFRFMRPTMTGWWDQQRTLSQPAIQALGLASNPLAARLVFDEHAFPVSAPPVAPAPPADPGQPLDGVSNYLAWLGTGAAGCAAIRERASLAPGPTPLLYRLQRHSALLEYVAAADAALGTPAAGRAEPELVGIRPDAAGATVTVWDRLALPPPPPRDQHAIGAQLDAARAKGGGTDPFGEFWARLAHLAGRPVAALEMALAGTLGLTSYRFDAWCTSIATRRLAWLRGARPGWPAGAPAGPAQAPAGVLVGGYAWVEKLGAALPSTATGGFVQAPSLDHAAAAAVLRSGFLAHAGTAGQPFAVDLSSRRARLARWLVDGVRTQPPGALLGYRLERSLHDTGLDRYIDGLRRLAPLGGTADATPASDSVPAADVVDGLALSRLHRAGQLPPQPAGVEAALADLDDTVDAIGDALLAESVFQVVRGSPVRAGAALDAGSTGTAPPPELHFLETPRTGVAHPQRLLVVIGAPPASPGWPAAPAGPAAAAEPRLDAWAGALLGDPGRVRCRAQYLDPATGATLEAAGTVVVSLAQLGLAPLDVVRLGGAAAADAAGELQQRLVYTLLRPPVRPAAAPEGAGVRLTFDRDPAWGPAVLGFPELLEVARSAAELAGAARPLRPEDLAQPGLAPAAAYDTAELRGRADASVAALSALGGQLASRDPETLRAALLAAAGFGITGAVPASAAGAGRAAIDRLTAQASAALKQVRARLAAAAAVDPGFDRGTAAPAEQVAHDTRRLKAVLGAAFPALPRFTPGSAADLARAAAASTDVQGGDPMAAVTWLQRLALVRPGAARLETALTYSEATGGAGGLGLEVVQVPFTAGARWSGLAGPRPPAGSVGLVVHSPGPLDLTGPVCGLFVDEMVETVPGAAETTGIALHHDQPNARAGQALLLAVPPTGDPWSADALAATVKETLDLARLRMVDPDAVHQAARAGAMPAGLQPGQLLPALYVAVNLAEETVSTDLSDLDRPVDQVPPRRLAVTVSSPQPLVQMHTVSVTVSARDAAGGALVDGTVAIAGLAHQPTGAAFAIALGTGSPGGLVSAPGFADAAIPWPPLVPPSMRVSVSPSPTPLGTPIQLTVNAVDSVTGAPVPGAAVTLTNHPAAVPVTVRFPANAPYAVTLRSHTEPGPRLIRPGAGLGPGSAPGDGPEPVVLYPSAAVAAPGYPSAGVPFDFGP